MKQAFALLALLMVIPANSAFSQATTTISYDAAVTYSSGPKAAVFSAGDRVVVSYTLNPGVADSNSDPARGYFPNAVLSLSVSFPDISVSAVAGASGPAQTFNNVVDTASGKWSDQVFFFGGPISSASSLDGEPIDSLEVDFLSNFVVPPEEPTMLSSDALPLFKLPTIDAFLFLHTSSGWTSVHFQAINPPTPQEAVELLLDYVEGRLEAGILTQNQADGLMDKLAVVITSLDLGATREACNQLVAFVNQVKAFIRARKLSPEEGQTFIDAAEDIRAQIGC